MKQSGFTVYNNYDLPYSILFCCGSFLYRSLSNRSLGNRSFFLLGRSVLGNYLDRNLNGNLLVEVHLSNEVSNSLGILHGDNLAINLMTKLLQLLCYLVNTY